MNAEHAVPSDFPREARLGAVTGAQPKTLARLVDGRYFVGPTDEEIRERYATCQDLVEQLVAYCQRKANEHTDWTHAQILERARKGVAQKAAQWQLSPSEVAWILERMQAALAWS